METVSAGGSLSEDSCESRVYLAHKIAYCFTEGVARQFEWILFRKNGVARVRMRRLSQFFRENTAFRRCLAFLFHVFGIVAAYLTAHLIRFDFDVPPKHVESLKATLWIVVLAYLSCIVLFRLYQGLWRFFTLRDCLMTALAFAAGTIVAAASIYLTNEYSFEDFPRSVLIIAYMLLLLWEIGGRGMVRLIRESARHRSGKRIGKGRVLLIGDPDEADVLLRGLQHHPSDLGQVVGIISGNQKDHGSQLRGVKIYSNIDDVAGIVKSREATMLLFLPPFTGPGKIRDVVDALAEEKLKCDYRVVPSIDEIASGRVDVSGIRKVAIEDLLHRVPYEVEFDQLSHAIGGKKILVTGAGGSIGSEICRQLIKFKPEAIVLFESSEFHLFQVERELAHTAKEAGVRMLACAGDVKRAEHLRSAIHKADGIDVFYHAAAYKHVDLMERNAVACFQNNVIGTYIASNVAEEEGIQNFVLISTDKAVRPTSLMGATKRLAERLLIERPKSKTCFKAVRFGNVLGSNGSVVPIFREQIERGGPVTVTSSEVTRFFMTISEAVELVLAAGAIDEDRRIFVLEMGEAVRIDAMARRMIELSGLVPDVDIPVVYTGLKGGEKEYEELLTDDENVVRTDLDRIWVVKRDAPIDIDPVDVGRILELIDEGDDHELRLYAHSLIQGSRLCDKEEVPATSN